MPTRVAAKLLTLLFQSYRMICNENKPPVLSQPLARPTMRVRLSAQQNRFNRNRLRSLLFLVFIICVLLANRFQFHLHFSTLINVISNLNVNFSAFMSIVSSFFYNSRKLSHSPNILKRVDKQDSIQRFWDTELGWMGWLLILLNLWFFLMCIFNTLFLQSTCFERVESTPKHPRPKVTVFLAARNEELNIERCLNSLLTQDYPDFEILVMNDDSTDKTGDLLLKMVQEHPCRQKLRVFTSHFLPSHWYGKAYSIQLLSKHATGDVYLVTDADTLHRSDSLSCCVKNLFENACDFISGKVFHFYLPLSMIKRKIRIFKKTNAN